MSRFAVYFSRLLIILLGYLAAALAASAMFHLLVLPQFGFATGELEPLAGALQLSVPIIALVVAYYAFAPSVFLIGLAELLGLRSMFWFVFFGGAIGILLGTLRPVADQAQETSMFETAFLTILVGCGIVGGLAYWLIAGRSSGNWWKGAENADDPVYGRDKSQSG